MLPLRSLSAVPERHLRSTSLHLQGPWKLCFDVHRGGTYRPPSLLLELSYFTVNHRSLVGTSYESEKSTQHPLPPDAHLDHPAAALAHRKIPMFSSALKPAKVPHMGHIAAAGRASGPPRRRPRAP